MYSTGGDMELKFRLDIVAEWKMARHGMANCRELVPHYNFTDYLATQKVLVRDGERLKALVNHT